MEGDFSHRIEVRGTDQLAELGNSFNRMTENLERLLRVEKEKERLQSEIEIAREVQNQLYPKEIPETRGLELVATCNPARMVSGDYYDYLALDGSKIALAIGDVAGKGISAALLMATVQASLRTQVKSCLESSVGGHANGAPSTARLVSLLNQQLYAFTAPEKFASFCFAVYDDDTGMLTYTNAGHPPPVLIRGARVQRLETNGIVVGAFPFAEYGESRLRLHPGDLLVCFTDGITEAENEYGEMFGEERLCELLRKHAWRNPQEIVETVIEAAIQWTALPDAMDDMTLLVARRIPLPEGEPRQ
jgi:sigma-B regulation protein RsbU (phosphoserine phosphatase)